MYTDWLGNPVTAASDATLAGIDDFLQGYLGYEVKAGNIFAAADADCAIAKTCQYHLFNLGDSPGMLRVATSIREANTDLPYMHGMLAFAYEQCHFLEEAERAARHAIALKRKEP